MPFASQLRLNRSFPGDTAKLGFFDPDRASGKFSRKLVLASLLFLVSSAPVQSQAGTRTTTGANGAAGTLETDTQPAGDGESGESVVDAEDVPGDAQNSLRVAGGNGGRGGTAFDSDPGDGGDGGSADATTHMLGGNTAFASATGGNGGWGGFVDVNEPGGSPEPGGDAGQGGNATASATGTSDFTVSVQAWATGGNGGIAGFEGGTGDGGTATLGLIEGISTGSSSVFVQGIATGGNGGSATQVFDLTQRSGNGMSISLLNRLNGSTTGRLSLSQSANGGSAGDARNGALGTAGMAESRLTETTTTAGELTLTASARGGNGGARRFATGSAGVGATAEAAADASNQASGSASANSYATGGDGGYGGGGAAGGRGADATASASSETDGAFGRISDASATATGGSGGDVSNSGAVSPVSNLDAGRGGDAVTNAGSTIVDRDRGSARAFSTGGDGGNVTGTSDGNGGDGGAAIATARDTRMAGATGAITTTSLANGGNGGVGRGSTQRGGRGGDVFALAVGVNNAAISVRGGNGGANTQGVGGDGGNVTAIAFAPSTFGSATVNVTAHVGQGANGGQNGFVSNIGRAASPTSITAHATLHRAAAVHRAQAGLSVSSSGGGLRNAEVRADSGQPLPALASLDGLTAAAFVLASPSDSDVQARLDSGNYNVRRNFDVGGTSDVLAHWMVGAATPRGFTGSALVVTSFITIEIDTNQLDSQQDLLLGLLDPVFEGASAFDSLDFDVQVEFQSVIDESFSDVETASTYFDDQTLNLGDWSTLVSTDGILTVFIQIQTFASEPGSGFRFDAILGNSTIGSGQPVPEPTTGLLLGLGLIVLSRNRGS